MASRRLPRPRSCRSSWATIPLGRADAPSLAVKRLPVTATFAMDAMLTRRPDHLKMPRPDAYMRWQSPRLRSDLGLSGVPGTVPWSLQRQALAVAGPCPSDNRCLLRLCEPVFRVDSYPSDLYRLLR